MARSDFGPEVKASMQGNANTPPKGGIPKSGLRQPPSPGEKVREQGADSSGSTGLPPVTKMPGPGRGGMPGMNSGTKPPAPIRPAVGAAPGGTASPGPNLVPGASPAHAAMAAGIAHAILGNRGLR